MRGCKFIFNGVETHTANDLLLVQETKEIGTPEVQKYTIEVPGRNGKLVLTKALTGRVTFYNREINLQYFASGNRAYLQSVRNTFNKYHGQTVRIIDDDTPDYYYEGEATVSYNDKGTYLQVKIKIDAQPFMYKNVATTSVTALTSTAKTVTINLTGEAVVPTLTVTGTGTATIVKGDKTITVTTPATWDDVDLLLEPGANTLQVSGTGNFTISYKEARI